MVVSRSICYLEMYFVVPPVGSMVRFCALPSLTSWSMFFGMVSVVPLCPGWPPGLRLVFSRLLCMIFLLLVEGGFDEF